MQISFTLEYHGWLDIEVTDMSGNYIIPASFMTDVIYDIIQRVSSLLYGAPETVIVIQTEPNECRIRIQRIDSDCIFEIFEFNDNFNKDEIDKGSCVFKAKVKLKDLLRKILIEINKLLDLGKEEYYRRWGFEFPDEVYERFTKAWKALKDEEQK